MTTTGLLPEGSFWWHPEHGVLEIRGRCEAGLARGDVVVLVVRGTRWLGERRMTEIEFRAMGPVSVPLWRSDLERDDAMRDRHNRMWFLLRETLAESEAEGWSPKGFLAKAKPLAAEFQPEGGNDF